MTGLFKTKFFIKFLKIQLFSQFARIADVFHMKNDKVHSIPQMLMTSSLLLEKQTYIPVSISKSHHFLFLLKNNI